jgi:hypothetical protein
VQHAAMPQQEPVPPLLVHEPGRSKKCTGRLPLVFLAAIGVHSLYAAPSHMVWCASYAAIHDGQA